MHATPNRYQEMEVLGASPAQHVVQLYTRILVDLRHARSHITAGNIEARTAHLDTALSCFNELLASLDRTRGGAVAQNLAALYDWFLREVIDINLKNDGRRLDTLVGMVAELHGAWVQALGQQTPAELST